jgi:hypothetical protein
MCRQGYIARNTAAERANKQRSRGNGVAYKKWFGRHAHRVFAEAAIGRPLLKNEIVHHLDGNKLNNDLSNLKVMSQSDHMKLHVNSMLASRKQKAGY